MAEKEIKKIALIISGGTCRGAAQVAFINELLKKIGLERLCVISASSIGSLTAYATGVGRTEELMEAYAHLDSDSIGHFIKRVKDNLFVKTFNRIEDELKVPTYVTVTRLWGLDCGYYCLNSMPRKDLKQAINASMGLPIFNGPLRFNKHICIDGGATDNIPVLPATYFDPDMIIIMHCFSKYYPPQWLYEKVKPGTIALVFFTLKILAYALAPSIPWFFAARILQAPSYALYTVLIVRYADSVVDRKDSAKAQSLAFSMTTIGSVLASLIGGAMFDTVGVRTTMLTAAAISAVGTVVALLGTMSRKKA